MALYQRLMGLEEPKLPVHQFMAVVAEFKRGKITAVQGLNALNLSEGEKTEVQTLLATADTALEVHDVLLLAEDGLIYDTVAKVKTRLGV